LLLQLVSSQQETYIAVDGLDECDRDTRHILMATLDDLVKRSPQSVKIYIASRTDQDLRERYQSERALEITANDNRNDIETFVIEQMKNSEFCSKKMLPEVRKKVLAAFREKSQGMLVLSDRMYNTWLTMSRFQWAVLQIRELLELRRNKDILKYLDQLPKGLEAAYDKIHGQISAQLGSKKDIAFTAFKILMVSWRPLSPEELVIAVVQDPEEDFHVDEDIDIAYLLDACHNLLVVTGESPDSPVTSKYGVGTPVYALMDGYRVCELDEDSSAHAHHNTSICRFSHLSVQEYLEKRWGNQDAQVHMACICLRTLLSLTLPSRGDPSMLQRRLEEDDIDARLPWTVSETRAVQRFRIVPEYHAGCDTEKHASSAPFEPPPFHCLVEVYHIHTHDDNASCISGEFEPFVEGHRSTGLDGWVAYAARGLEEHLSSLSQQEADHLAQVDFLLRKFLGDPNDSSDSYRAWTVLNQNNYKALASAVIASKDSSSGSTKPPDFELPRHYVGPRALLRPIWNAALGCAVLGLHRVLKSWLEEGVVSPTLTNETGDSLLALATARGHQEVCQVLAQKSASVIDVNAYSSWGDTHLHIAVGNRMAETVRLFLDLGADPNLGGKWDPFCYPIQRAVVADDLEIASLLLEHGADVMAKAKTKWDQPDSSPFVIAAQHSNVKMVSLLLKYVRRLEPSDAIALATRALEKAVEVTHDSAPQVIRLLMSHVVSPKNPSVLYRTVSENNWVAVKALVDAGADLNLCNKNDYTPLMSVVTDGDPAISKPKIENLLRLGASIDVTDSGGRTALYIYVTRFIPGDLTVTIKFPPGTGPFSSTTTPEEIDYATRHKNIVSCLLAHGANPNHVDLSGTPLLVRACIRKEVGAEIIKLLLDAGADVNAQASAASRHMTPLDAVRVSAIFESDQDSIDEAHETSEETIEGKKSDKTEWRRRSTVVDELLLNAGARVGPRQDSLQACAEAELPLDQYIA
jgi:ankyrin repeat protein